MQFTINDYLDQLKTDKQTLVDNLLAKGVSCSSDETFTTLVPKVAEITPVNNQSKSITITSNTTTNIEPDSGYTGLSSVSVTTNVSADMSEYFDSTLAGGGYGPSGYFIPGWVKGVKKLNPNYTQLLTTNNAFALFYGTELPLLDTTLYSNFQSFITDCPNLTTIPIYNTASAVNMQNMVYNCPNLNTTSLDNILQMCINATRAGTKTLYYIGLRSTDYPASTIEALPHYQDFIDAGWTIGY